MTTPPAIELSGLVKRYGPVTAVDHLDMVVPPGQIVALLGPNGAGKSTATEMILGLTRPDAGRVRVFGADPVTAMRRGDVGAMLQNGPLLWDTTVAGLVGGRHVTFTGPERDWSTLPGVLAAARVGGRVTLTCSDADAALRALVASTDAAHVRDIETASPTLEDAFLSLVSPVTSGASA